MGLKPWRNTLAWFITSYVELLIVMISIAIILLAGKILPRSDPLLVLILLFDYIFSIVTFWWVTTSEVSCERTFGHAITFLIPKLITVNLNYVSAT